MKKRKIRPPKVEFEFTDLDLTALGGASVPARTARRFGLLELLDEAVSVKVRNRGASDTEVLWAIVASLARGHGALSDLDALRADTVASTLPGLGNVPEARRAGEWLGRMSAGDVKGLWHAAIEFAARVAPAIVDREVRTKGYVPVFIDATGIEVDGQLLCGPHGGAHGAHRAARGDALRQDELPAGLGDGSLGGSRPAAPNSGLTPQKFLNAALRRGRAHARLKIDRPTKPDRASSRSTTPFRHA